MRFPGRVIYLVDDPAAVRHQLAGGSLSVEEGTSGLRDEISTDEIIPARFCVEPSSALASHCYEGLRCGAERPVAAGDVAAGRFAVSVAGLRRGKGSSREQAPYAEREAGIRLVMARSFERIYRSNCHNLGVLTSTRLDLLPRLVAGDDVPLDELCDDLDDVALDIAAGGGLFPYMARARRASGTRPVASVPADRPAALAEKILAGHASGGAPLGPPGSMQLFRCDLRYSHEYVTPMAAALLEAAAPGAPLVDPDGVILFEDHLTGLALAPSVEPAVVANATGMALAQEAFSRSRKVRLHGRVGDWSDGICHVIVAERYAAPGLLVIGSDSHTCHVGAVGCVAVGVGASDVATSWLSGEVLLPVPRHVLVRADGRLRPGVTEKDLMLHLLRLPAIRDGAAIGAVVEFAGEAVTALDVDARCTLTNMTSEMGATSGIVAPDRRTVDYLVARRGLAVGAAEAACAGLRSDPEARYDVVVDVAADAVEPMVSLPGDPGNAVPLSAVGDVRVDRAYGGSCTAAKRRDMDLYAAVLRDALADGRRVHDDVEMFVQVGSGDVLAYCEQRGYVDLFRRAGATVLGPACGACINAGPGASTSPSDVTISAQNRNFPGRSGPGSVYLASPLTVAASAVAGRIRQFASRGGLS